MAIVLETHLQTANKQIMHTLSIFFLSINEPWKWKCMNRTIWTSQDMNMIWSNKTWEWTEMNSIHASVDAIQASRCQMICPPFSSCRPAPCVLSQHHTLTVPRWGSYCAALSQCQQRRRFPTRPNPRPEKTTNALCPILRSLKLQHIFRLSWLGFAKTNCTVPNKTHANNADSAKPVLLKSGKYTQWGFCNKNRKCTLPKPALLKTGTHYTLSQCSSKSKTKQPLPKPVLLKSGTHYTLSQWAKTFLNPKFDLVVNNHSQIKSLIVF